MLYIPYLDIASKLPFAYGDTVYLASDVRSLALACARNGETFDSVLFLRRFIDKLGRTGTLLLPVFNWDFCKGVDFDFRRTQGKTGSLGNCALGMPEFKRTRHPIYSFAVCGMAQEYLCGLDNQQSFGPATPFQFIYDNDALMLSAGLSWEAGFTYKHHAEQVSGNCWYRFHKEFRGAYVNAHGHKEMRSYSMFVRHLDKGVLTNPETFRVMVEKMYPASDLTINATLFSCMRHRNVHDIILNDLLTNKGANLVSPVAVMENKL